MSLDFLPLGLDLCIFFICSNLNTMTPLQIWPVLTMRISDSVLMTACEHVLHCSRQSRGKIFYHSSIIDGNTPEAGVLQFVHLYSNQPLTNTDLID